MLSLVSRLGNDSLSKRRDATRAWRPLLPEGTLVVLGPQHPVQDGAGPAWDPGMLGGKVEGKNGSVYEGG